MASIWCNRCKRKDQTDYPWEHHGACSCGGHMTTTPPVSGELTTEAWAHIKNSRVIAVYDSLDTARSNMPGDAVSLDVHSCGWLAIFNNKHNREVSRLERSRLITGAK